MSYETKQMFIEYTTIKKYITNRKLITLITSLVLLGDIFGCFFLPVSFGRWFCVLIYVKRSFLSSYIDKGRNVSTHCFY